MPKGNSANLRNAEDAFAVLRDETQCAMTVVQFRVTTLDVGVPEEAEQIVKLAESLAPVAGVFHLAMYLADKLITNQVSGLAVLMKKLACSCCFCQ